MKISDCMTSDVRLANPTMTIQDAARIMAETDAGVVPVGDDDRLVGMLTDRDITIRAICAGKGPDTLVRDVMSSEIKYCYDDEDVERVAASMAKIQVRRMPVVNRDKRLVGIVALADLATKCQGAEVVGSAVGGISRSSSLHNQSRVR